MPSKKRIIIKRGTNLWGLHPAILRAMYIARDVIWDLGRIRLVVTSAWDADHSPGSFHHWGMAIDLRTKELASNAAKREFELQMRRKLGSGFDVLLENLGGSNEHLHIEWEAGRPIREQWMRHLLLGDVPAPEWDLVA